MKINKKNLITQSILILIGLVTGYLIYYYIFMELVVLFVSRGFAYYFVSILCLIGSIVGSIVLLNLIFYRKINKPLFYIITITYFCVLFSVLFLRRYTEQIYIFNPLISLKDILTSRLMLFQSFMNFIVFIPIGYFVRKLSYKKVLLFSILFSILIEFCQVLTRRGFFDTLDIILYVLAITLGYFISKKLKLDIR
jgi:hypothetical protein